MQDSLKVALKDGTLALPAEFETQRSQIAEVLRKVSGRVEIKNADERKQVPVRKAIYLSAEFRALWDRIKHQTTYRVQFDNYQKLGDDHIYAQELFDQEELTGHLKNMLRDTEKSIYEHVVYDSSTERDFADALEKNDAIQLYTKLPGWFKVPTPLGSYNPDWAVLVEQDGAQRAVLCCGNQEQPVHRRSTRQGERQACLRQGAFPVAGCW